jgi:hypothetical protein
LAFSTFPEHAQPHRQIVLELPEVGDHGVHVQPAQRGSDPVGDDGQHVVIPFQQLEKLHVEVGPRLGPLPDASANLLDTPVHLGARNPERPAPFGVGVQQGEELGLAARLEPGVRPLHPLPVALGHRPPVSRQARLTDLA